MKKLRILLVLVFILTGCTNPKDSNLYSQKDLSTEKVNNATLKNIDIKGIESLVEKQKTFLVIASLDDCKYCIEYKEIISNMKDFDYEIYELSVTEDMEEEYISFIQKYPYDEESQEILFPSTFIFEHGDFKANSKGVIKEETLKEWIEIQIEK